MNNKKKMLVPYYKIVDRKEVFGGSDTGKNTCIKVIDSSDEKLEPLPSASLQDKEQYAQLGRRLTTKLDASARFTMCAKAGYFEFNKVISENELKAIMESIGFNEFD